ncbi:MAG: hypothetical protein J2P19_01940 [Pseudonocardia sp.]|nr:hypothetical protein [Pseudonocardia sp.]
MRLWDVTDPAKPAQFGQPLTGQTDPVYAVAFNPDGRLASTGRDRTIWIWDLNVDHAIQRICATTSNILTPEIWRRFISSDQEYRYHCSQ